MADHELEQIELDGSQIGPYLFIKRLTQGGSGAIAYHARQRFESGKTRDVAIKVWAVQSENRSGLKKAMEKIRRDYEPLLELAAQAPIVQIIDAKTYDVTRTPDGQGFTEVDRNGPATDDAEIYIACFLIMEYANGGGLSKDYRTVVGTKDFANTYLSHFKDVCVALKAAHDNNIVHCDVKPDNIFYFIEPKKRVKLGDFGIARQHGVLSLGSGLGTLPYLAPEVFGSAQFGDQHTFQSDIYALGCTFFELLAGKPSFAKPGSRTARSSSEVLATDSSAETIAYINAYSKLHSDMPRPDVLTSDTQGFVSFRLNELLKDMMSVDPAARPPLETIIETLEKDQERQDVRVKLEMDHDRPISDEPVYHSLLLVNPSFRKEKLKEFPVFFFLRFAEYDKEMARKLLIVLDAYLGRTYSIYEVFGNVTLVIRFWTNDRQRVLELVKDMHTHVTARSEDSLEVLLCDNTVNYSPTFLPIDGSHDLIEMLIRLHKYQTGDNKETETQNELLRARVLLSPPGGIQPSSRRLIKCFCLVKSVADIDEGRLKVQSNLIRLNLTDGESDGARIPTGLGHHVALYRRSYQQLDAILEGSGSRSKFARSRYDHVISFVVDNYHDIIRIPEAIFDIPGNRLSTSTLLSTGRYFIDSDRVFIVGSDN